MLEFNTAFSPHVQAHGAKFGNIHFKGFFAIITNDPNQALGAPDAFYEYATGDAADDDDDGIPNYLDVCEVGDDTTPDEFLSLGGEGGFVVLRMGGTIEQGDSVEVLEVGDCDFGGNNDAIPEEVEVAVSVAREPENAYWVTLGTGEGPEILLSVPDLPVVEPEE